VAAVALLGAGALAVSAAALPGGHDHGNVTVFATGLANPRGLTFGPDGGLYVAEGGTGGTLQTVGLCTQAPFPVGPYSGGMTSRISRIDRHGNRSTVADHLPSSSTGPALGGLTSGVADVTFIHGRLYGLEAGAGCSHGLAGTVNSIFRVNFDGSTKQIANLSAFQQSHPVANPEPDDFEPDGTWYSMVAVHDDIYAVEPNHGEVDRIDLDSGAVSRVVDVSASQGHIVPTALTYKGNFYFGNLGTFPVMPGTESIFKLTPSGNLKEAVTGLTTVLGLEFDEHGTLYALESVTAAGFPNDPNVSPGGAGKVVRIDRDGTQTTVVEGLTVPTAMTFGPDGDLYISNLGFGAPPGAGEIVRVDESCLDRHGNHPACSY
jgi:hypothetical protein